jgi:hypothetical protein
MGFSSLAKARRPLRSVMDDHEAEGQLAADV